MSFVSSNNSSRPPFKPVDSIPSIEQVNEESGRFYRTPAGDFPSVTTFLGKTAEDTGWLDEWRERVGDVEADRITAEAAAVGNHYHDLNESWIRGRHPSTNGINQESVALHMKTLPILCSRYSKFLAAETRLWSAKLQLAGTVDFVAETKDGELVIGDFKNSRRGKSRDQITDYWHQVTIYGIMWWELTGRRPKHLDIVIGDRMDAQVKVYREPFECYISDVVCRVEKWRTIK